MPSSLLWLLERKSCSYQAPSEVSSALLGPSYTCFLRLLEVVPLLWSYQQNGSGEKITWNSILFCSVVADSKDVTRDLKSGETGKHGHIFSFLMKRHSHIRNCQFSAYSDRYKPRLQLWYLAYGTSYPELEPLIPGVLSPGQYWTSDFTVEQLWFFTFFPVYLGSLLLPWLINETATLLWPEESKVIDD